MGRGSQSILCRPGYIVNMMVVFGRTTSVNELLVNLAAHCYLDLSISTMLTTFRRSSDVWHARMYNRNG
jgi:hypothetical protein